MSRAREFRFGPYTFEPTSGRLKKYDRLLKLQPKPATLLGCLLAHSGEVVSRAELQRALWPEGTHVDFDLGIKVAVKKLRDSLSDDSDEPKYIQTVPGEGYRFIAPVQEQTAAAAIIQAAPAATTEHPPEAPIGVAPAGRSLSIRAVLAFAAILACAIGALVASPTQPGSARSGSLEVTTRSNEAAHLYSEASELMESGRGGAAIDLLTHAVNLDPSFASGEILLAHVLMNTGRKDEAPPHFEKALRLSDRASEREQLFIIGSYYDRFAPDAKRARDAYEVATRRYPQDFWPANNLMYVAARDGDREMVAAMAARIAVLRPSNPTVLLRAARFLDISEHTAEAQQTFSRLDQLLTPEMRARFAEHLAHLQLVGFGEAIREHDAEKALAELAAIRPLMSAGPKEIRTALSFEALFDYVELGRLRDAWECAKATEDDTWPRENNLLLFDAWKNNIPALKRDAERLLPSGPWVSPLLSTAVLEAGLKKEARVLAMKVGPGWKLKPFLADAADGKSASVMEYLYGDSLFLQKGLLAEWMSRTLEDKGDVEGAIQLLRQYPVPQNIFHEDISGSNVTIFARFHLAELLRRAGRTNEASEIERDLLTQLKYGDEDFWMLRRLRRQHARPVGAGN